VPTFTPQPTFTPRPAVSGVVGETIATAIGVDVDTVDQGISLTMLATIVVLALAVGFLAFTRPGKQLVRQTVTATRTTVNRVTAILGAGSTQTVNRNGGGGGGKEVFARLRVTKGSDEVGRETIEITNRHFSIGRTKEAGSNFIIPLEYISGLHCTILYEQDEFRIRDEKSANGTYVDGQKLMPNKEVPLPIGATIRLSTQIELRLESVRRSQPTQVAGQAYENGANHHRPADDDDDFGAPRRGSQAMRDEDFDFGDEPAAPRHASRPVPIDDLDFDAPPPSVKPKPFSDDESLSFDSQFGTPRSTGRAPFVPPDDADFDDEPPARPLREEPKGRNQRPTFDEDQDESIDLRKNARRNMRKRFGSQETDDEGEIDI
jgi:pSer/pThr/pTyr-binding forkhead associated (FHA) protein